MSDFFAINLPYGIARNKKNEWIAFNREYMPLGFNNNNPSIDLTKGTDDYPVYTKYKEIHESTLLKLAVNDESIGRDNDGDINQVWFYDDRTNPVSNAKNWDAYFEKIKIVSAFKR